MEEEKGNEIKERRGENARHFLLHAFFFFSPVVFNFNRAVAPSRPTRKRRTGFFSFFFVTRTVFLFFSTVGKARVAFSAHRVKD